MNRRRFIIEAGKAFPIVAGAFYIVGCDSNTDGATSSKTGNNSSTQFLTLNAVSTVVAGHSHSAAIPIGDLNSATGKSYESSSSNSHKHMVSLSAAQLGTISTGTAVTVVSSNFTGHAHQFTFSLSDNDETGNNDTGGFPY